MTALLRRLRTIFGGILTASGALALLGLPADIWTWRNCLLQTGERCQPIRAALPATLADLSESLASPIDVRRAIEIGMLLVGVGLLVGPSLWALVMRRGAGAELADGEARIIEAQIERSVRLAASRDQAQQEFADLDVLRHEGWALRDNYRARKERRPSGPTAPATVPVHPYDGFEIDEWSGRVLARLKRVKPPALTDFFMGCDLSLPPPERLACWLERLEQIMAQVQRKY